MTLDKFPILLDNFRVLKEQYDRFLADGLLYGAFSHARGFKDRDRGIEVLDRLISDHITTGNITLAHKIGTLRHNVGIEGLFEIIDHPKKFMYLEEHGELPPELSNVQAKSSSGYLSERVKTGMWVAAAAVLIGAVYLSQLNSPSIPNREPENGGLSAKPPVASSYNKSELTPSQLDALQRAGWMYVGNGVFEYRVNREDRKYVRGISQVVANTNNTLGAKIKMDAKLAGKLADQIAHTKGSQVRNLGRKGNWDDLKDPKKNVIMEDYILRAHITVMKALLTEKF